VFRAPYGIGQGLAVQLDEQDGVDEHHRTAQRRLGYEQYKRLAVEGQ
jgi:hypothetical protein